LLENGGIGVYRGRLKGRKEDGRGSRAKPQSREGRMKPEFQD
jgi:hypothetical protein